MKFEDWIAGFEDRYTEDQLWHMKWAWEVGQSKLTKSFQEFLDGLKKVDGVITKIEMQFPSSGGSPTKLESPEKPYPYKNAVCRGCWTLGTACGKCEKCIETAMQHKRDCLKIKV